jgi:beta-galactosidase
VFPNMPVTIPADAHFLWPINLDLAAGGTLAWATAQPLCVTGEGRHATWYFAETPGVPTEFVFTGIRVVARRGKAEVRGDGYTRVLGVTAGREPALILNSSIKVVLLTEADSLALRKENDAVRFDDLREKRSDPVAFTQIRPAGPLRKIESGKSQKPVAAAPGDADFANAAVWRIILPPETLQGDGLLRLYYTGDVARVYIDGQLITDDYYNGQPLEIGLRRHAAALAKGELTIAILPLQKNAPIYLPESVKPNFRNADSVATLDSVDFVPTSPLVSTGAPQ